MNSTRKIVRPDCIQANTRHISRRAYDQARQTHPRTLMHLETMCTLGKSSSDLEAFIASYDQARTCQRLRYAVYWIRHHHEDHTS